MELTTAIGECTFPLYSGVHAVKDVNVTELRQKLPAYLEKVRKGKRIRITSRGRVIAELSPPTATVDEVEAARALLKGSIRRYEYPFEPAIPSAEWDAHQ